MTTPPEPSGLSGWLLLLTRWLIVGQPVLFAFTASSALAALPVRGLPLGVLIVARLFVTAFGLAAGLAMTSRRPAALGMTTAALAISAATDVFTLTTSVWPNNRVPGDTPLYIAVTVGFHGAWLIYLRRSEYVRATFG